VVNPLPGGESPVTWQANFTSETPGLNVSWKWSAAVYSNFNTDLNALGVKASDGLLGGLLGSRAAGTPQNYTPYLIAGARSNGGSNFTGSYSSTQNTTPDQAPPPTGISLSGSVYIDYDGNGRRDDNADESGIEGVVINLSGFDLQGNAVTRTVTTDANGHYTFTNLPAGTYQISEEQPRYIDAAESVGTVNGQTRGEILGDDVIGNIALSNGDVGIGYDFGEILDTPT
jgi:SdrD B-like domain